MLARAFILSAATVVALGAAVGPVRADQRQGQHGPAGHGPAGHGPGGRGPDRGRLAPA